jgi:GT2 family glycosyltransferase
MADVTICVPHVNRVKALEKCLQAIFDNVTIPYKILVIYDGKMPSCLDDDRVTAVETGLDRTGIGFKRHLFAKMVDTKYLFAVDNDVLVEPNSLELQVQALEENPLLGAVSGLVCERGKPSVFPYVASFCFFGNMLYKHHYSLKQILESKGCLFVSHFIPMGYTLFRVEALKEVKFDKSYVVTYEHMDVFLQFYSTKWQVAVHKMSKFNHLRHYSKEYAKVRLDLDELIESKQHFIAKWGLYPVDSNTKSLFGKIVYKFLVLTTRLRQPFF